MKYFISILMCVGALTMGACQEKETAQSGEETIVVRDAYAFATMPNAKTAAAFMVIKNNSSEDDRIIGVESSLATHTEIHENIMDADGTMMMRKVREIAVPAGNKAVLEPKGYHVMFIDLNSPLSVGENASITLLLEKSGAKDVNVEIVKPGTMPTDGMSHEH